MARIVDGQEERESLAMVDGERKIAYVRGQIGEVVQIWLLSDAEFRELGARIAAARRAATPR